MGSVILASSERGHTSAGAGLLSRSPRCVWQDSSRPKKAGFAIAFGDVLRCAPRPKGFSPFGPGAAFHVPIFASAQMNTKLRVAVLFGGRSAEHDVSILSARNVFKALDTEKYDVAPILIDRQGQWLLHALFDRALPDPLPAVNTQVCLLPGGRGRLFSVPEDGNISELPPIDILFPVLHGPHGEDGSVQGHAEVAMVPFAGCGILGSATAIDKDVAKRLLSEAGLPVARSLTFHQGDTPSFEDVAAALGPTVSSSPPGRGRPVGVAARRGRPRASARH